MLTYLAIITVAVAIGWCALLAEIIRAEFGRGPKDRG